MAVYQNLNGTTAPSFKLGKGGPTLFKGDAEPAGVNGDFWFDSTSAELKVKISGIWELIRFGNLKLSGNTISSIDTNGDINLIPDGLGNVVLGVSGGGTSTMYAPEDADAVIGGGPASNGNPGADLYLRGGDGTAGTGVDGNVILDIGNLNLSNNDIINGGTITASSFVGPLTGNADTASTAAQWTTTRTIGMSGDVSSDAVNIDGSGNITITNTVVGDDSHTHSANNLTGTTLASGVISSSLTSVGTLTALQVDSINIDGNTISSTAGTDLNITPLASQQLVLDSTIIIDAGSMTGLTTLGLDGISLTAVQTSAEGFADNNTSIMTSAAVDDRILSYNYSTTTGTVTSVGGGTGLTSTGGNTPSLSHDSHTGQVTGATALSLDVTAITAQPASGAIVAADTILTNDGGVLSETTFTQLNTYFNSSLSFTNNTGTVTEVGTNTGLSGTVTSSGNLSLDLPSIAVGGTLVTGDWLIADNGGTQNKQLISAIPLSIFNNDDNWTSNTGTVTSVGGGTGLTSTGGTTPSLSHDSHTGDVTGADALAIGANKVTLAHLEHGTQGDILYYGATGTPARLGFGTTGQVLQTNGTGANPSWEDVGGVGTVTEVGTNTGLSGTVTSSGNLSLDLPSIAVGGTLVTGDWLIADNGGTQNKQLISAIPLSIFNNDDNWTSNLGTVTSVGGGTGLTSTGGTTPSLSHDSHTGQVTGATALSLDVTAITAQPASGAIIATDTILTNDGGTLSETTFTQLNTYFNSSLSFTNNAGTVTSVGGTGTVSGLTLSGTVTGSGNLTLGGSITGFEPTDSTILRETDVDDTPVNGVTTAPVSSNWAFDHQGGNEHIDWTNATDALSTTGDITGDIVEGTDFRIALPYAVGIDSITEGQLFLNMLGMYSEYYMNSVVSTVETDTGTGWTSVSTSGYTELFSGFPGGGVNIASSVNKVRITFQIPQGWCAGGLFQIYQEWLTEGPQAFTVTKFERDSDNTFASPATIMSSVSVSANYFNHWKISDHSADRWYRLELDISGRTNSISFTSIKAYTSRLKYGVFQGSPWSKWTTGYVETAHDVIPSADGTNDLGLTTRRWNNFYTVDADIEGNTTSDTIRLTSVTDVGLASSAHALQIGPSSTANIAMDDNEIMARNNGAISPLYLNNDGGSVICGGSLTATNISGTNTGDEPTFAGSTAGLVPTSVGGTTNFLRADGSWAAAGGGSGTVTSVAAGTGMTFTTITTTGSVAIDTTQTAITSMYNTSLQTGYNTTNYIDFNASDFDVVFDSLVDFRFNDGGIFEAENDIVAFSSAITSDRKVKKDFEPIENALDMLENMHGQKFTMRKNDRRKVGLIAQDVQTVLPEAVNERTFLQEPDYLEEGEDTETYLSLDYDAVVGVLVEAVKELSNEVKSLKAQINKDKVD